MSFGAPSLWNPSHIRINPTLLETKIIRLHFPRWLCASFFFCGRLRNHMHSEGHPRSLIFVWIESACATSY